VANVLPVVAGALLAIVGLGDTAARVDNPLEIAVVLLAGSAVAVLGQKVLRTPTEDDGTVASSGTMLGWLAGVLIAVALYALLDRPWLEAVAFVAVAALLFAARGMRRAGLIVGTQVALIGAHVVSWTDLVMYGNWAARALTPRILLGGLAALVTWFAGPGAATHRHRPASIDIGLAAFLLSTRCRR
jgi:hypothetical protein